MRVSIQEIDRVLRGVYTRREDLAEGRIHVPARTLAVTSLVLGALYGVFMGLYGVVGPAPGMRMRQFLATTVKVPSLFLLTLLVTFPSLYVFSALSGSRLLARDTLRLVLVAIVVNLAVLASFGPVTGFFTLSTDSYPFLVVLNVVFFALAGLVGLAFLWRALKAVFSARSTGAQPRAGEPGERRSRAVLVAWTVIYAFVGAQMGWILRPFIGAPYLRFEFFRSREESFFHGFLRALGRALDLGD
jgi:hypothetical protein